MERKMFEEHVTIKILTFIEPQEGARDPDRRLDQDPGYAFQGVKISYVPELSSKINFSTLHEFIVNVLQSFDGMNRSSNFK